MKTKIILSIGAATAVILLGACSAIQSGLSYVETHSSQELAAVPDIESIVSDATSKSPNYAADISTGIDLANDFEPGSSVALTQLTSAVEDGINTATGSKLTSTASAIAAALKVLPDVMSAEQATQVLIGLSKKANAVSTAALSAPATSGMDPDNQVFYAGGWQYRNAAGTWPMMDERAEVSPLGSWWRDRDGVEFQKL